MGILHQPRLISEFKNTIEHIKYLILPAQHLGGAGGVVLPIFDTFYKNGVSYIPHANDGDDASGRNPLGLVAYQQKCQKLKNKPQNSTAGKQSTDRWES